MAFFAVVWEFSLARPGGARHAQHAACGRWNCVQPLVGRNRRLLLTSSALFQLNATLVNIYLPVPLCRPDPGTPETAPSLVLQVTALTSPLAPHLPNGALVSGYTRTHTPGGYETAQTASHTLSQTARVDPVTC